MSETTPSMFVRQELVGERPAPIKTTGFVGFLRTRMFNSPTNVLLTIVSVLLLWFIIGTSRLFFGVREHGFVAIRDYALVYYGLFFYLAQHVFESESLNLLTKNVENLD